ncbi:MAG TPA: fructosamine kinase family protein [Burkholderiales bacterium]
MRGFRKEAAAERAHAFAAEADGLEALRPYARVPRVLDRGIENGTAFILLEHLDLERGGDYAALGRMLAALHRQTGPRFGWARDNYIGLSPQQNAWCDSWSEFWRERRLRPQAERAGVRIDLDRIELHQPPPSLLHGDLWSGNAGFTAEGPVIYDPAVYYGDREADLAMTELFGGFPRAFYDGYNEVFPLPDGYERRKHLYNLYHLLNHLNIFGGSYLGQVNATLRFLGL